MYEPLETSDGYRVLVDRLWPRGYRKELDGNPALDELRSIVEEEPRVTLLYGSRDEERNHAVILQELLNA